MVNERQREVVVNLIETTFIYRISIEREREKKMRLAW
jgi:hypothetical protein